MSRRRDPSPFGSRRRGSSSFENMFWVISGDGGATPIDSPAEDVRKLDLFDRLRARRILTVRVVLEAVVFLAGVYLMSGLPPFLPFLGAVLLMIGVWAGLFDVIGLVKLHRSIAAAWTDLTSENAE